MATGFPWMTYGAVLRAKRNARLSATCGGKSKRSLAGDPWQRQKARNVEMRLKWLLALAVAQAF